MPNVGIDYFLSLPFTFPVVVNVNLVSFPNPLALESEAENLSNVNPCQIYTQNTQISIFNFFPPKLGALPKLQECPCSLNLHAV